MELLLSNLVLGADTTLVHLRGIPLLKLYHARTLTSALLVAAATLLLIIPPSARAVDLPASPSASMLLGAPSFTSTAYLDGTSMQMGMDQPYGVAIDAGGSVYVADNRANRLLRWAATPAADGAAISNVFQSYAASKESWQSWCTGGANNPERISVSGDAATTRLLVADTDNNRVLGFLNEPTADATKATLFLGQTNSSSCDPNRDSTTPKNDPPTATTLSSPEGVWTDGTKVAVADSGNHRVLLWNTWPANGDTAANVVLGQANFTSGSSDRGGAEAANTLDSPTGVWFDGTRLYVADKNNNRVLEWDTWPAVNGQAANHVLGQLNFTSTSSTCNSSGMHDPTSVATYGSGAGHRIAVSMETQHRVLVWNAWPTTSIDNAPSTAALGQNNPSTCSINNGQTTATSNTLREPWAVSFDGGGNLWVADTMNHRVLRYAGPAFATNQAANRVLGHAGATAMTASLPYDDPTHLFVQQHSDDNGAQSASGQVSVAPSTGALLATSLWTDASYWWSTAPSSINQAVTTRFGQALVTDAGDNGPNATVSATSQCNPAGTWTDGTRVLVADSCANRVLVWTTPPSAANDPPDYVIGQSNFTSNTSGTSATRLRTPWDVASDGNDVYVADRGNNRIVVYRGYFAAPSNLPTASIAFGQADLASGSSSAAQDRLRTPVGVDLDSQGHLVVADNGNNRVMVWTGADLTMASGANAAAVVGQSTWTANGSGTLTDFAQDVAIDGNALMLTQTRDAYIVDPLPTSGPVLAPPASLIGIQSYSTVSASNIYRPTGIDAARGQIWLMSGGHARLMRWDDTSTPTFTAAPTATVRCDGTVTVSWTTSESTSTEIRWDTVSRASWGGGYANQSIDTSMTGLTHSVNLSFAAPGVKYARVQARDWTWNGSTPNAPVISSEINFTVPAVCGAPSAMLGDDANAQGGTGRTNPSATNAPAINSTTFHTSWLQSTNVTMDAVQAQTWSTPPEHAGGLWHLDAGSGAADPNSQTSNAITWSGAPATVAGRFTDAKRFTADTQYGTIADAASIRKANDFTLDLWFSTADISNSAFPIMVAKSDGSCGSGNACNYSIEFDRAANQICAAFINTSTIEINACASAASLTDGAWHYAAMTVSSSNALRLYVDGVLTAGPTASAFPPITSTDPLVIGQGTTGLNPFRGAVDEVRFAPVAYDAAAILGYYRTRRPHADQLWDSGTVALASDCATGTRCEDQVYAGQPNLLREGARYWQRTRLNTKNNDYWSDWGTDWLETTTTTSLTITAGSTIDFGTQQPGSDSFATSTLDVTTNAAEGYTLTAHDEDDSWSMHRLDNAAFLPDRQNGVDPPAAWPAGTASGFGIGIQNATGGRLAKWGTIGGPYPLTNTTDNYYTALENTSEVTLHQRMTYAVSTDTINVLWRANPPLAQAAGAYTGTVTFTALANP